jgi:hypothetical protein
MKRNMLISTSIVDVIMLV